MYQISNFLDNDDVAVLSALGPFQARAMRSIRSNSQSGPPLAPAAGAR